MKTQSQPLEARRSANYRPSLWEHENLLLLGNKYAKEDKIERAKLLKQEVSRMLDETEGLLEQLELVDNLQRLGISYHFEREIKKILTNVHVRHVGHRKRVDRKRSEDLYATALKFRLLRQHGFNIAQDVFGCFFGDGLDDEDIKSVLSLYEASYLSTRFDTKLKKTIYYTTTRLKKFVEMKNNETTSYVRKMVIRALEMPYHRRVRRLEARWYIDVYGETHDTNPNLLELAKLDFNFVQVIHQDELKSLSRWDVNRLEELPKYMKLCFLCLINEINQIGYIILRDKGFNAIPYLKKSWADMCTTFLKEAKWYKRGYRPKLEEYMENGWLSSSVPTILLHLLCLFPDQNLDILVSYHHHVIRNSATILRLANDLATSSKELARGDNGKSVQCHMHETGSPEAESRAYMREMIGVAWEDLNLERNSCWLHQGFVEAAANLGRVAQCIYQYGDGYGSPEKAKTVDHVRSLLVYPVP
ncbi:hypothetical protein F2Q69_00060125 [Brassica cretica]|uniref:Terpene synthase N-terminal domain-containing protein n=2 Tax=Brassica TaxID=3705 RepID=A0A8S9RDV2_BRACR|nr:hypothetical protein F2Q69_00060125 [Brassica cretica]